MRWKIARRRPALLKGMLVVLLLAALGQVGCSPVATSLAAGPVGGLVPTAGSTVDVVRSTDGSFQYLVNGTPTPFIGMGYNPIYRYLSDDERAANYDRDFRRLCRAGVNTILGWDADKGYEQDKFDGLTLDSANKFGLGVVMPFYLPPDGDYQDPQFLQSLLDSAAEKIARFKDFPALRMWGVGNEVLNDMTSDDNRAAFAQFYPTLADEFHSLDPSHPVIYRAAETVYVPLMESALQSTGEDRPWLLFGTNVYSPRLDSILASWPSLDPERPLIVTEFGADPALYGDRGAGYEEMWQTIRAYPSYVLGGAAYAWTVDGPEPTDRKWGLMDNQGRSVDDTFGLLANDWRSENSASKHCEE